MFLEILYVQTEQMGFRESSVAYSSQSMERLRESMLNQGFAVGVAKLSKSASACIIALTVS